MFKNIEEQIMDLSPDIIKWNVEREYGHLTKEQLLGVIAQMRFDSIKDKIKFVKTRYNDSLKHSKKKNGLLAKIQRKWEEIKFKNTKVNPQTYLKNADLDEMISQYTTPEQPQEVDNVEESKILIGKFRQQLKEQK